MKVVLQPLGETLECAPDETVLDAAFRQGYNLAYGCREGQCSACKCYLQAGDVALKPYSTFALSDSEEANGYTLMCRAMPESDLAIELLHFDPDSYRLEHPIRDGVATVADVEEVTHDIVRLVLKAPSDFAFTPGQYVDLHVPGEEGARRSFSLANAPGDGRMEFLIKRYPGGRLSGMLGTTVVPGVELGFTGPYGAFHLRKSERPILMVAGGSGMAPILALLRQLAAEGCERPVRFYYGARSVRDLFGAEVLGELGSRLADFTFLPILSEGEDGRFVHEAVDEFLATGELEPPDVYMCGPPPMIEAAEEMLTGRHAIPPRRIHSDKFTTSAAAAPAAEPAAAAPPVKRFDSGPAPVGDPSERAFSWYEPRRRRASLYEDVTVDTQPSVHRHLRRGWPLQFDDGRGIWWDSSTALTVADWFAFRDPGEQWERPFYQRGNAAESQIEGAVRSAAAEGVLADFRPEWVEFLRSYLQVPAYVEHGLWFAAATAARDCLSDSITACVALQAAHKQRSAQALVLYAMDLEPHHGPFPIEEARERFLSEEAWQPARAYVERLASLTDWGEVVVAANLCFEPLVGTLLRRELGIRAAALNGDTVTPVLARVASQEWEWASDWTAAFVRFAVEDEQHGEANRARVGEWAGQWLPLALEAALALAPIASRLPVGMDVELAAERVRGDATALLAEAGVPELASLAGASVVTSSRERAARPAAPAPPAVAAPAEPATPPTPAAPSDVPATPPTPAAPPDAPPSPDSATYDFVGIVMAKSAEGDAVADILSRRDDIAVHEQPAFWDIRAKDRLVIPYDEVSEELGYEIDAYSIQHEMSTHYGRMVATDEALMLFSDPTEAMQYLMA